MLNLPYLKIEQTLEEADRYMILAFSDFPPEDCCDTPQLVKNGSKRAIYRDLPMHGKHVGIWFDRQRWTCRQCNGTVYQCIPHMHHEHSMTYRLVEFIEKRSLEETFASLSRQIGVSEGTIRGIFRKFAARELAKQEIVTPRWMGIDEIHFLSKFRGIITNVENRTLVDLIPQRSQSSIATYLYKLHDRKNIEVVTIDMWEPYRRAVQAVLPGAKLVVDRYHIARMANEALERIRKDLRASLTERGRLRMKNDRWLLLKNPDKLSAARLMMLDAWLQQYPVLKMGYEAKERYRAIWKCTSKQEAEERYKEWCDTLHSDIEPAFCDLKRAMQNWHHEIFGYFETRLTNAYTECVNGLGKILNRLGRGYSFEVIRAKMLLNYRIHKMAQPRFNRQLPQGAFGVKMCLGDEPKLRTFGIDISTLRHESLRNLKTP